MPCWFENDRRVFGFEMGVVDVTKGLTHIHKIFLNRPAWRPVGPTGLARNLGWLTKFYWYNFVTHSSRKPLLIWELSNNNLNLLKIFNILFPYKSDRNLKRREMKFDPRSQNKCLLIKLIMLSDKLKLDRFLINVNIIGFNGNCENVSNFKCFVEGRS